MSFLPGYALWLLRVVSSSSPVDGLRVGLMKTLRVASIRDSVKHLERGVYFLTVRVTACDTAAFGTVIKPFETSFVGKPLTS